MTTTNGTQHLAPAPKRGESTRVLMIGCGQMGGALLTRWIESPEFQFTVISPSGSRQFPATVQSLRSVTGLGDSQFDIVVIGVKPQMIKEVLPDYLNTLAEDGVFVSIAAGFACSSLAQITHSAPMIRVMPNLPVSIGKGVSGLYADPQTAPAHRARVERLMTPTGKLVWVDSEDALDRLTAIAGSGPGFAFEVARSWVQAAEALGFSADQARAMVLGTIEGAIELALSTAEPLDELRNRVTSKNGATYAGLLAMNGNGQLDQLLEETVQAAYDRAVELR